MERVPSTELLDSDAGTSAEVRASLEDLQRINRWFGGVSTTRAMVREVATRSRASELSLLEVAAGSGDVAACVGRALARHGIRVRITLLDRVATHFQLANGAARVVGDALALPFPDNSFDMVCSGLFVHHLGRQEVVRFVTEALRVCRRAVLINDLIRHPLHLAAVYAGLPLQRSRLTWNDAPASVRQAYTVAEMREMLRATPAARVDIGRHYLFRMGAIAWKE